MILNRSALFLCVLCLLVITGCSDKDSDPPADPPPDPTKLYLSAGWDTVSFPFSSVNDIQFPDNKTGYFVGTDVYKSTDGGQTWKALNVFNGVYNYAYHYPSFPDVTTGYAVIFNRSGMIKTTDGGQSWTTLFLPAELAAGNLFQVKFISKETGFVAGVGGVFKTSDGGITWSRIYDGKYNNAVCAISNQEIWIGNHTGIARTTDGINFTHTNLGRIHQIQFFDNLNGVSLGMNGTVYQTSDGGVTWQNKLKVEVGDGATDLHFFDKDNGYVSGYDAIVKVSGNNSSTVVSKKTGLFYEFFFFDRNHGMAGSGGNYLYTFKTQ